MQESAALHSVKRNAKQLDPNDYSQPRAVRDYLERQSLLEAKEKQAIASVYGLLSNTGGHPYMAEQDQARLMRHLALTFSQFVMLRLMGCFHASP